MSGDELKTILTNSGIKMTEAATLFVVSRHAVYDWIDGTIPKNKLIRSNTERMCVLLNKAVELKQLPLPPKTPRHMRMQLIRNILQKLHRS